MSEAGDNREGTRRPFTRRPDGSWPLQDARERREQRDTAPPAAATTTTGEPGEDHQLAYALGLADSMLTSDGTPCNQQLTAEQDEIETGLCSRRWASPSATSPPRRRSSARSPATNRQPHALAEQSQTAGPDRPPGHRAPRRPPAVAALHAGVFGR